MDRLPSILIAAMRETVRHSVVLRRVGVSLLLLASPIVSSCSPKANAGETEADIHRDNPMNGTPDHPFVCNDQSRLMVDFRGGGFTITIRDPKGGPRVSLTAPRQGAIFVGEGVSAKMVERQLQLTFADGRQISCIRQTDG